MTPHMVIEISSIDYLKAGTPAGHEQVWGKFLSPKCLKIIKYYFTIGDASGSKGFVLIAREKR